MSRSHRPVAAVLAVLTLAAVVGCTAAGGAPRSSPPPPRAWRTVVERDLAGGTLVVEVVEAPAGVQGSWWAEGGRRRLLAQEVAVGDDRWVRLAMTEHDGITEPGWIHLDLSDPDQRRWFDANPVGVLDQRTLWTARVGDRTDWGEVTVVERPADDERRLRLADGSTIRVTRRRLVDVPRIGPPRSLPVVALDDVEELLAAR
jgi:hypothetical protein